MSSEAFAKTKASHSRSNFATISASFSWMLVPSTARSYGAAPTSLSKDRSPVCAMVKASNWTSNRWASSTTSRAATVRGTMKRTLIGPLAYGLAHAMCGVSSAIVTVLRYSPLCLAAAPATAIVTAASAIAARLPLVRTGVLP